MSPYNNASSRGNPLSSSSSHQNPLTYLFINVLACNRCFCIFLLIQTRQLFHWRKRYYELWTRVLDESNILQVKIYWWMHFLWKQLFSSQDVNWWTGVEWITVMFLSAVWTAYSDGTHSLQSIHWWASGYNAKFLQIWWRNKLISWMAWRRVHFHQIFIFKKWVTGLQMWPKWNWLMYIFYKKRSIQLKM